MTTGDHQLADCVVGWGSSPHTLTKQEAEKRQEVGGAFNLNAQISVNESLPPARLCFTGISDPWPLGYNPQKIARNTKFISLLKTL